MSVWPEQQELNDSGPISSLGYKRIAAGNKSPEPHLGWTGVRGDGDGVPALIPIIQHTSDNAAQMPELRTQVLGGLVLIAANWRSNTSRRAGVVAGTEGTVKWFCVRAGFDYPSVLLDKRREPGTKRTFVSSNLHRGPLMWRNGF